MHVDTDGREDHVMDDGIRTCRYCLWDISRKHPGATWRLAWGDVDIDIAEEDPYVCVSAPLGAHDPREVQP